MSSHLDEKLFTKFQPLCVTILRSPNSADSYKSLRSALIQSEIKDSSFTGPLFTFIYVPLRAVLLEVCQSLSSKPGRVPPSASGRFTEDTRIALLDCLSALLRTLRPPEDVTPLIELFNLLCICSTSSSTQPKSHKPGDSSSTADPIITTNGLSDELLVSSFNCFNFLFSALRSHQLPPEIISLTASPNPSSSASPISSPSTSSLFSSSTLPMLAHFVSLALDSLQQRSCVQLRCSALAALQSLVHLASSPHLGTGASPHSATETCSARDPADCLAALLPGVCSAFSRVLIAASPSAFHHSVLVALLDTWRDLLVLVLADRNLSHSAPAGAAEARVLHNPRKRTDAWAERELAPRLAACFERVLPALVDLVLAPGAHFSCRVAFCEFLCALLVECAQALHSTCLPALLDALLSCASSAASTSASESAATTANAGDCAHYVERVLACERAIRVSVSLNPSPTDASDSQTQTQTQTQSQSRNITFQKPLREFLVERLSTRLVEEVDSLPHVLRTCPAPARRLAALARVSSLVGALGRCGALATLLPSAVSRLVSALMVGAGALDVRRCTGFLELRLTSDALDEATSERAIGTETSATVNASGGAVASDRFRLREFPKRHFEHLYEEAAAQLYLECLTSLGRYADPVALLDHLHGLLSPSQSTSCHVVYALGHVIAGLLSRAPAVRRGREPVPVSVPSSLLLSLVDRLLDNVRQIDECLVGVFSVQTARAAQRSRELSLHSALCFEALARLALAFSPISLPTTSIATLAAEDSTGERLDDDVDVDVDDDSEQLYLLRVLYPTLNATQSAFAVVRETALCALEFVRRAFGLSSVAELLRANSDYLVDDVCTRMRRCRDFLPPDSDTANTGTASGPPQIGDNAVSGGAESTQQEQPVDVLWTTGFPLVEPANVLRALLACGGPSLVPLVGDVVECLLQWLDDLYMRSDAETALYIECLGEYCRAVQRANSAASTDAVHDDNSGKRSAVPPSPTPTSTPTSAASSGGSVPTSAAVQSSAEKLAQSTRLALSLALPPDAERVMGELHACHQRVSEFREELRAARAQRERGEHENEEEVLERMQRPPHELLELERERERERALEEAQQQQQQQAQGQKEEERAQEEAAKAPPLHVQLVQACIRRAAQHMAAPSVRLQLVAVRTLRSAARALASHETILLPTLHSIWQPLVCRLSDSRLSLTPVICETYTLLCELMSASGDFLVRRVREDVLPALLSHVERALHEWSQLVRTRRARARASRRAQADGEWSNGLAVRVELHAPEPEETAIASASSTSAGSHVLPLLDAASCTTRARHCWEALPASGCSIRDLDVMCSRVRRLVEAALTLLISLLRTVPAESWVFSERMRIARLAANWCATASISAPASALRSTRELAAAVLLHLDFPLATHSLALTLDSLHIHAVKA